MPNNDRGTPIPPNHTPSTRDEQRAKYNALRQSHGLKPHRFAPDGYGNYSNPETAHAQRQTDREFDKGE